MASLPVVTVDPVPGGGKEEERGRNTQERKKRLRLVKRGFPELSVGLLTRESRSGRAGSGRKEKREKKKKQKKRGEQSI